MADKEELELFEQMTKDDSYEFEDMFVAIFGKPQAAPPSSFLPPHMYLVNKFINFEFYIEVYCRKKIKIVDRKTFHQIKRPIVIGFNHFREMCYYHTKWLDIMYELSLKYGEQMEFIAADLIDMDLLYAQTNPLNHYCTMIRPEDESLHVYVIDEKKRIYHHSDAYQTLENLSEVCEKLINGSLFKSQERPKKNEYQVKICVHLNFEELVIESNKDILLIVGKGDYCPSQENEPNYEEMAKELKDTNMEIIYIDGDKNYIPFKYHGSGSSIIFISSKDKNDFIRFSKGRRNTENLMDFLRLNASSEGLAWRQEERNKLQYKPFTLPKISRIPLEVLKEYLGENFPQTLEILDRHTLSNIFQRYMKIICFMNIQSVGADYYKETLEKLYQLAQSKHSHKMKILIADIHDIDIIYPKWYQQLEIKDKYVSQLFLIDRIGRTFKLGHLKTESSLFYYLCQLHFSNDLCYSQLRSVTNYYANDRVKTIIGHDLKYYIRHTKNDVFLTIYWDSQRQSSKILKTLDEIAETCERLKKLSFIKMNAKLNYVPLEYSYTTYPIHFYIPANNKDERTIRYKSSNQSKVDLLKFIKTCREIK